MLPAIAAFALMGQDQVLTRKLDIPNNPRISVFVREGRLDPSKKSPKVFPEGQWEFDWITTGFGNIADEGTQQLRVRVYAQEHKAQDVVAPLIARMVMQIWDRSYHKLKLDSPGEWNSGIVDYFLCFGGAAGGEQLFQHEIVPGKVQTQPVNTIYIYRMSSFNDPVEMAREVAHEYGHAILPPIGGFKDPEVWADGDLGEKLFLKWLRDDMISGKLTPEDTMGASIQGLSGWIAKNNDLLIQRAAFNYPDPNLISDSKSGMDSFCGLALYTESLCPPQVFMRSLTYTSDAHRDGSTQPPGDYGTNVLQAASEVESLTLSVPRSLLDSKKPIWIPLGKGKLQGATILSRKEGWAQVAPLMPNIVIKNPPIG